MGLLTREAILAAEDRTYEEVDCPEWGGVVRLRSMTGAQRDRYEQSLIEQRGGNRTANLLNARAKMIVICAVGADDQPLFTEADVRDLGRKNAKPLDRLFDACRRLSGLSEEDVNKLTEDFAEAQSDDSTSD